MKRFVSACLLLAGLAGVCRGAPALFYVNDGIVSSADVPPVVNAVNFVNNNLFDVLTSQPYRTASTLNFTNRGVMDASPGFDFRTFPAGNGQVRWASSFYNKASGVNGGIINCSGGFAFIITPFQLFGNLTGNSKCIVAATNIVSSGSINMDASSMINLNGVNVDLTRGALSMQNTFTFFTGTPAFFNAGILDGYWGIDYPTNAFFAAAQFNNTFGVTTPPTPVTFRNNQAGFQFLSLPPNAQAYVNDTGIVGSNRFVQAVFIDETNSAFANNVFFTPLDIEVQWTWTNVDAASGTVITNFLVLSDDFGERTNNARLLIDGFVGVNPTYIPDNYTFFSGFDLTAGGTFTGAPQGLPPGTFDNVPSTNQETAYEAIFSAATQFPSDLPGGDITNISGRIEIYAKKVLKLDAARISPLNTLIVSATNHYDGNKGASISAPYYDLNLRTTNGVLALTNLVPETLPHPEGTCELWSGRWTNVVNNITNSYHVLVIESRLSPVSKPLVDRITLRNAQEILISDQLNITRSLLLTAPNITLTTNGSGASSTVGSINLLNDKILWSIDTPRLQNLTNWGYISTINAVFFGGSRSSPFYTRTFNEPYLSFVNHGGITNHGSLIWAQHFENYGVFDAGLGAIKLQKATDVSLVNGAFLALTNDILIAANNLTVTNHPLLAGAALELDITNSITDGGGTNNGNIFTASDGFSTLIKPETGDLLSTIVTNSVPPYAETKNVWAGEDRGANTSGFQDNLAIGDLVLNGGNFLSVLHYIAAGDTNALYVDRLELQGSMTNIVYDGISYNVSGLHIDSNFTIYYADAIINGQSQPEHINGANHGHLVWVPGYTGNFSSVTLSWTNGTGQVYYYKMNAGLRNSCDIDSDSDGLVNCVDPTPLGDPPDAVLTQSFNKDLVNLSVAITNQPAPTALISWNAPHNATNFVYAKTLYVSTNWTTVTNFVNRGPSGRLTIKDPIKGNAHRFYRVRVDPPKK